MHAFRGPTAAERLGHVEDAVLGRGCGALLDLLVHHSRQIIATRGKKAHMSVLKRTHGLAKGLLEGTADGHDLANRLHAGGQRGIGALELLKGKTRNLDHAVIDGGLEASRGGTGDVVDDLVKRIAHGQARGGLGDGEAGGLGSKRGAAAYAGIHLDDDEAAVFRVDGKLNVGTAGLDADLLQDSERRDAHALVLEVRKSLRGSDGDGIAGMHAHGVQVLDGAHDDAVASVIAHDLHLVLFPADD